MSYTSYSIHFSTWYFDFAWYNTSFTFKPKRWPSSQTKYTHTFPHRFVLVEPTILNTHSDQSRKKIMWPRSHPYSTISITTILLNSFESISNKHTLLNFTLTRTSPSDSQYSQCTSASPPPSTYLLSQTQPHTIPFSSFQLFHFAFSYTLTIPFLSYGKVEHARSTDIAISNRSLLEQRVTSQLVLVAHRLRWMPTTNELCNLVEFLLSHHILYTLSTSRSDISHSQQTILYFFFNFFFSFISFIRNFNASKCAFNSSKFVLFRVK